MHCSVSARLVKQHNVWLLDGHVSGQSHAVGSFASRRAALAHALFEVPNHAKSCPEGPQCSHVQVSVFSSLNCFFVVRVVFVVGAGSGWTNESPLEESPRTSGDAEALCQVPVS